MSDTDVLLMSLVSFVGLNRIWNKHLWTLYLVYWFLELFPTLPSSTHLNLPIPHYSRPEKTCSALLQKQVINNSSYFYNTFVLSLRLMLQRWIIYIFQFISYLRLCFLSSLTLSVPCFSESCIEITIKLNFYFHTSSWCLKRFYEGL